MNDGYLQFSYADGTRQHSKESLHCMDEPIVGEPFPFDRKYDRLIDNTVSILLCLTSYSRKHVLKQQQFKIKWAHIRIVGFFMYKMESRNFEECKQYPI
ncbi:hypothetical protein T06_13503 [Trichinella sp. T6]|nr:hypothetical protein T06_13503 [Trichinella sp. T6]